MKTPRAQQHTLHFLSVAFLWLACLTATSFCADTFKLNESLRDKLVCEGRGEDRFCDVGQVGQVSVSLHFAWPQPGFGTNINEATAFALNVGNLSLSFSPSDDPKWVPGKKLVTLFFTHLNDRDVAVRDGKAVLRWNARGFTVTVSSRTGFEVGPVLAGNYTGNEPGPIADAAGFQISFGDFARDGMLNVTWRLSRRNVGSSDEPTELNSVTVRGALAP